ncbi:GNAT family N-acetyltransferase [Paenibacillus favisporus]|uniref:GNAT family N-acetyltransferase n=1 Tax=Paenibacillus favisporus TaxID=221028 RepID=UPI002DBF0004|nr:GNAT family N-acetyltransferase [Paenibacillus favisporus]MEC0173432.1 GNAT family N-acetyltransferase [Paenibacillus favisporus]
MSIRQAAYDDYPVLAKVHVESWKTTYRGMIADAYLDQLTVESRMERWKQLLSRGDKDLWTFVSEDEAGRVSGFIQGGKCREEVAGYDAEIYALYLLKEHQGKGHGRLLVNTLIQAFRENGFGSMYVWVLKDNPARQFYMKMGGSPVSEKTLDIAGQAVLETGLAWDKL